jgi:hypothetical protein
MFDADKQAFWMEEQSMLNIPLQFIGEDVVVEIKW